MDLNVGEVFYNRANNKFFQVRGWHKQADMT